MNSINKLTICALLGAMVSVISANTLVDSEKYYCSVTPLKEICSSLITGSQCGVLKECLIYWKEQQLEVSEDEKQNTDPNAVCASCQDLQTVLQQVKGEWLDNDMEYIFKSLCKQDWSESIRTSCLELVDLHMSYLKQLVVDKIHPSTICSLIQLCRPDLPIKETHLAEFVKDNFIWLSTLIRQFFLGVPAEPIRKPFCQPCHHVMTLTNNEMLERWSVEDLTSFITQQACHNYNTSPAVSASCAKVFAGNGTATKLVEFLIKYPVDSDRICTLLHLC